MGATLVCKAGLGAKLAFPPAVRLEMRLFNAAGDTKGAPPRLHMETAIPSAKSAIVRMRLGRSVASRGAEAMPASPRKSAFDLKPSAMSSCFPLQSVSAGI